jgi:hypothetical protein
VKKNPRTTPHTRQNKTFIGLDVTEFVCAAPWTWTSAVQLGLGGAVGWLLVDRDRL